MLALYAFQLSVYIFFYSMTCMHCHAPVYASIAMMDRYII